MKRALANFFTTSLVLWTLCNAVVILQNPSYAQEIDPSDTTKVEAVLQKKDTSRAQVNFSPTDSVVFQNDTIRDIHNDVSPLDIGSSRGIFILSSNRLLQLRVLGSVRANFSASDQDLKDYQTFNPYFVPTDVGVNTPVFFGGIQQTRLAFEVTRRTKTMGDSFIRIEGDFKNDNTSYRIRHAYGQIGGVLIGQTWSLMNNVSYQPALVSLDGPAGSIGLRTPQIRFSRSINNTKSMWSAAIEYSLPSFSMPDSINGEALQVLPDFTGRYSHFTDRFSYRVSALVSTISGRVESDDITYSFGYGLSFAGWLKTNKKSKLYLTLTTGQATSHFVDMFAGNNEDMIYSPISNRFVALVSNSGFLAYDYVLKKDFSASIAFGMASISNQNFQTDAAYSYSYNTLFNLFWEPINGSRLGMEYATGQRFDKGGARGKANRVSILMYYDF